jgi:aspartate-semialdehyde dehydrogenase
MSDSACKFIDLSGIFSCLELVVLNMHVEALRVAEQQSVSGDGGETGVQLMKSLRMVIRKQGADALDRRRLAKIIGER